MRCLCELGACACACESLFLSLFCCSVGVGAFSRLDTRTSLFVCRPIARRSAHFFPFFFFPLLHLLPLLSALHVFFACFRRCLLPFYSFTVFILFFVPSLAEKKWSHLLFLSTQRKRKAEKQPKKKVEKKKEKQKT